MGATRVSLCEVYLQHSRYHLGVAALSHVAALLALWLCSVMLLVKVVLSALVVVHGHHYYRRFIARTHPLSISAVRLLDEEWRVRLGARWFRAWPEGEAVVTATLISFRLSIENQRRPSWLILFPDSADPDQLHAFRLRLLLESATLFGRESE